MSDQPGRFDERVYIRLDHGMPENPKVAPLSDAAFRAYVEWMCWCSRQRTNGFIPVSVMSRSVKPKVRNELITAGLLEECGTQYEIHDYLMHQRSAVEIDQLREHRADAGTYGNHVRWHVGKRRYSKDCEHCQDAGLVAI